MSNFLIAIAVFVITVVGALFAVPYFVDWNSYRSYFEEEASRVINREVQVDGDVKLHILPTPYFRLEKVRIAEAASANSSLTDLFFRADALSVKLSIPPMFRGIVEANEIEFQRPTLHMVPDAKGQWNWQGFARALGSAAYMPANVTLTSLKISDGILALHGTDGQERGRLEGLNGELSSPSLSGPYRFRGSFHAGGAERELRLATAPPEADGSILMRASLRFAESGATYVLDARVAELMGRPHVDGELTARLPIAGLWDARPAAPRNRPGATKPDEGHDLGSGAAFDLKANVTADADGASLSNIALSFEQGGRPQLVTGSVRTGWRKALTLDMKLASRWLDLDRITAATDSSAPYTSLAKLAGGLRDVLPAFPARVAFSIDQANLGGEVIGPVQFSLARSAGPAEIEYLRAGLPGGSRGELKGTITGPSDALEFSGALGVRGTSAARFIAWATGSARVEAKEDGAFTLDTKLSVLPGTLEAKGFRGNLTGTTLNGSILYSWSDRPQLNLAVEGPQVDVRALLPEGGSLPDMYALLVKSAAAGAPQARALANLRLDLQTGQLITAHRTYRDVAAKVRLEGGHLKQLQLSLSGDDGYALQLAGRVDHAATRPKGTLRGTATARTAAGMKSLIGVLGLPPGMHPDSARIETLVPLRLAGTLTFADRNPASTHLVADGDADGMTVRLAARLEGAQGTWKDQTADITVAADADDSSRLAALVFAGRPATSGQVSPGRLLIKATGIPAQGLQAVADIQSAKLDATFRGQLHLAEQRFSAAGDIDIRKADGAEIANLTGLATLARDNLPITAALELRLGEDNISMRKLQAQVGETKVSGDLVISRDASRRRVEGSLRADEIELSQLISPLLDHRLAVAGTAQAALTGRQSPWPDLPFGDATLEALDGTIDFWARRLVVASGMAVEDARFKVAFAPGKLEVKEFNGSALGGQVSAGWTIDRISAGAEVRGKLTLTAFLDRLAGKPVLEAAQPVRVGLEFSAKGISLRGAMSAAQGKGAIEIKDARLAALWPGAVAAAADAAMSAEPGKMGPAVRTAIEWGLGAGAIPLGPRTIALDIVDGQLRMKATTIETRDGRVSGSALLDLGTLDIRSQWHLQAPQGTPPAKGLPSVVVDYSGPVAALGTLTPRIDTNSLEQELAARKIERDVEELERLRKLDEQRRLMEAERLRRQFETPPIQRPPVPSGMPAPLPGGSLDLPAPG